MNPAQHKPAVENPNADVIAGLREAADWLEAHPELPSFHGLISHYAYGKEAREALTTIAAALGDRATEQLRRDHVFIEAQFAGRVRVSGDASIADLGARQVKPVYEPIIKPCPECRGAGGRVGYSVRTGLADPQTDDVCERCEGSGRELF